MAKILSFDNWRLGERYAEASREVAEMLDRCMETLSTGALNLAVAGVWCTWDAHQPEGAMLHLDLDDLRKTDDPVVTRLMQLYDQVEDLRGVVQGEPG